MSYSYHHQHDKDDADDDEKITISTILMMIMHSIERWHSYVSLGLMRRALPMRGNHWSGRSIIVIIVIIIVVIVIIIVIIIIIIAKYHNRNDIIQCNLQVAEFEAMVESVPTVFIMSFALAVTGGKGVITEEGGQNLFSPEVSFLCLWLIVVHWKTAGATLPIHFFDLNCLGNTGHDQTTQVRPLQNTPIRSVPS